MVAHHKVISAAVATLTFEALAPQVVSPRLTKKVSSKCPKSRGCCWSQEPLVMLVRTVSQSSSMQASGAFSG